MVNLLSDLYELDLIDIKNKLCETLLEKFKEHHKITVIEFKEENIFGKFYNSYKHYKTLTDEEKNKMKKAIITP